MTVYCASVDCKYNGDKNRCTAKGISLSSHSVMTVWDGRQEFWKCKNYEMSEEYRNVLEMINKIQEGQWGN